MEGVPAAAAARATQRADGARYGGPNEGGSTNERGGRAGRSGRLATYGERGDYQTLT